jgi:hypothetical protein
MLKYLEKTFLRLTLFWNVYTLCLPVPGSKQKISCGLNLLNLATLRDSYLLPIAMSL